MKFQVIRIHDAVHEFLLLGARRSSVRWELESKITDMYFFTAYRSRKGQVMSHHKAHQQH